MNMYIINYFFKWELYSNNSFKKYEKYFILKYFLLKNIWHAIIRSERSLFKTITKLFIFKNVFKAFL